jgi:hypothetical protein
LIPFPTPFPEIPSTHSEETAVQAARDSHGKATDGTIGIILWL